MLGWFGVDLPIVTRTPEEAIANHARQCRRRIVRFVAAVTLGVTTGAGAKLAIGTDYPL